MGKVITLKIRLESNVVDEIDDIGEGLSEMSRIDAKNAKEALDKIDRTTLNQIKSEIKSLGDTLQRAGDKIRNVGTVLAVGLTAPIVAATYALGKYGLEIDAFNNQLTAFEGSSEKAEARLSSLRKLVDETAGATREMAYGVYGFLKPLNLSDETINKTIQGLGRLKLGFKNMIPTDFAYNLTQIFGQGFEEGDIKQAIGQVPKFRDYLVKAFGTADNETLQKMKASGKITMDSFFQGIAEAVQNDSVLKGLKEPVGLRMQKFFERAFESVEPLANKIVDILAYVLETATPYLQQFGQWFQTLSPYAQNLIVVVSGIAAAVAPVLIVFGSLVSFFAPMITGLLSLGVSISAAGGLFAFLGASLGTVATFIASGLIPALVSIAPIVLTVVAVLAAVTAAAVALYASWVSDFGGIKTYTLQVWAVIKSAVETGMNYIYSLVQSVGGEIVGFWRDNYDTIKSIVVSVSESIKSTIGAFLDAIKEFWQSHGSAISSYVQTFYGYIKSIVGQLLTQISSVVRLGLQILSGDWSGAWQSILKIIENGAKLAVTIWRGFHETLAKLLAALIPIVIEYGLKFQKTIAEWIGKAIVGAVVIIATLPERIIALVPKMITAGIAIGKAIYEGIKEGMKQAVGLGNPDSAIELSANNTFNQQTVDYSRPQDVKQTVQNVASLNVGQLQADSDKLKKEREALAKSELSAQIGLFANQAEQIKSIYDKSFAEIVETFKEANNPSQFQADWDNLKQWYGEQINTIAPLWDRLVEKQTLAEKKGQNEKLLAYKEHQEKLISYAQITLDRDSEVQKLLTQSAKKISDEEVKEAKKVNDEKIKIGEDYRKKVADAKASLISTGLNERFGISEQTKILQEQIDKGRELTAIEAQQIKNQIELIKYQTELKAANFSQDDIETLSKMLSVEQQRTLELLKQSGIPKAQIDAQKQGVEASKTAKDLDGELEGLKRNGRELTQYEKTLRQIETVYKDLRAAEKQDLLNKASAIDQQKQFNKEYEQTFNFIRSGLDVLLEKGKSWGEKFKSIFDGVFQTLKKKFLDFAATFFTNKIMGGGSQSGGGLLGSLLGGGGTPGFNPNAGSGGGGIGGLLNGGANRGGLVGRAANFLGLGGLFGGTVAAAAPAAAMVTTGGLTGLSTTAAGILAGGSGAGIAGGSAAAGGAGAGAGGFGALVPFLTNPWTIGIAGAALGAFALWKLLGKDKTLEKLKDAASAQYAVKVSDNSVLKQIKQIGEGYYGKGNAAKDANATVGLEESKNVLRAYAERTNQNFSKIDGDKFKDENWAGNQFGTKFGGFREFGGDVQNGMAYIVGEKRPELFVPKTSGTIYPSVNLATPTSAPNDSIQAQQNRLLMNMMETLTAAYEKLEAKIEVKSAGDLFVLGARQRPDAAADAVESEFSNDPTRTEKFFRQTGQV